MLEIYFITNTEERIDLMNIMSAELTSIDGMGMTKKDISKSDSSYSDGTSLTNIKHEERNIIFNYVMNGNDNTESRKFLYEKFGGKLEGKIHYKDDTLDVEIKAYCEEITSSPWNREVTLSISFYCPYPFFNSSNTITNEIQEVTGKFHFPLILVESGIPVGEIAEASEVTLSNLGQMQTPLTIELKVTGDVTNPIIYDYTNNIFFGIDETFVTGEKIIITNGIGNKTVTKINTDNTATDLFYAIKNGSDFLSCEIGNNTFFVSADTGSDNLKSSFSYNLLYYGVD